MSNLPTVWTNVLVSCLLATGYIPNSFWLLLLANSCFYMAGMSLNDFCDAHYDQVHRPTRPIPSGRISKRAALIVTIMMFVLGLMWLMLAPFLSGAYAGLLLVLAIIAYDFRHKRHIESVLLMASCRLLVFLETSLALTNEIAGLVLLAGGIQFCYIVIVSLVARYENAHPDFVSFPLIPTMIAGIALLDGIMLAGWVSLSWLAIGIIGFMLTLVGQRYVRGD